jgi:hypothetical protein
MQAARYLLFYSTISARAINPQLLSSKAAIPFPPLLAREIKVKSSEFASVLNKCNTDL